MPSEWDAAQINGLRFMCCKRNGSCLMQVSSGTKVCVCHVKAIVTLSNLLAGTLCRNVHIVTSVMLKRELESVRREHSTARDTG